VLIPPGKEEGAQFEPEEVAVSRIFSAVRAMVERVNHSVIKVNGALRDDTPNITLYLHDLRIEIALAIGNMQYYSAHLAPDLQQKPHALRSDFPHVRAERITAATRSAAAAIAHLYWPVGADEKLVPAPPPSVQPPAEVLQLWTTALSRFPANWAQRLHRRQQQNTLQAVRKNRPCSTRSCS